jgi:hypothetical protein
MYPIANHQPLDAHCFLIKDPSLPSPIVYRPLRLRFRLGRIISRRDTRCSCSPATRTCEVTPCRLRLVNGFGAELNLEIEPELSFNCKRRMFLRTTNDCTVLKRSEQILQRPAI